MVIYFIVKLDSNVVERFSYDIFGKRRNVNGTDDAGTITAGNNIKGASPRRGYTGHEMLDSLSLVHMNGRVYDPGLGRVLSADPIIQAPYMTQSYNRYSYVMNNPLALTDPSGYNWLTKGLRGLIFGVTSLIPAIGNRLDNFFANSKFGQFALSSILTFYGGSPGAALASAYLTAVQGGSESDIFMAGLKTGATAFAFELAGGVGGGGEAGANSFGRYAAHAGAGCLSGYANGEGCGRGAASAVAGKFMTNGMDAAGFDKAQMFVGTVVAGGVTSALGGGKFANGAMSAAYGYILNYCSTGKCDTALEQAMYDWWPGYKAGTGLLNSYRNETFDFTAWEVVDGVSVGIGAAGKGIQTLGEAAGPLKQWLRVGPSYSRAGEFEVEMSIRWGASPAGGGKYIEQIPSTILQNANQWLRAQQVPFGGWRAADPGHFHLWR